MTSQHEILHALESAGVRHVLCGVGAANLWALDGSLVGTHDAHEIVVAPDGAALSAAWRALRALGFTVRAAGARIAGPFDEHARDAVASGRTSSAYRSRDRALARFDVRIPGFEFEDLWREHRVFRADGVALRVARLAHVLASIELRGARSDALVLATWSQGLHDVLEPRADVAAIVAEQRARTRALRPAPGPASARARAEPRS